MKKIDWEHIRCPIPSCNEKRKEGSKRNKVWYDAGLSEKHKGKMVFFCTNHKPRIYFVMKVYIVNDDIVSVRRYVFQDRLPNN